MAGIPVASSIAILRYGLYDIDLVTNRTLVYGVLTATLGGVYLLVMVGLGELLRAQGDLRISVLATIPVAVLFTPCVTRCRAA